MVNVENMCKSMLKSMCIFKEKLCVKLNFQNNPVKISLFPPRYSLFHTTFSTEFLPLINSKLFHFYTDPTTIITNKLEERN